MIQLYTPWHIPKGLNVSPQTTFSAMFIDVLLTIAKKQTKTKNKKNQPKCSSPDGGSIM